MALPATLAMIEAARRAEYDFYQRGRMIGSARFIPTPDDVIKVMIQAALDLIPTDSGPPGQPQPVIVTSRVPRRRR